MPVKLLAYSPIEAEVFATVPEMDKTISAVAQMVMDLNEGEEVELLFVLDDDNSTDNFTLAFAGTTLALEFSPEAIEVTKFDETEGSIVLQSFPRDNINQATAWLVNNG